MAQENQDKLSQQEQQAIDLGAATTRTSRGTIYTLTIVGQIEGHQVLPETVKTTKYEHVLPLLAAVEESEEIDGLLKHGGDKERHDERRKQAECVLKEEINQPQNHGDIYYIYHITSSLFHRIHCAHLSLHRIFSLLYTIISSNAIYFSNLHNFLKFFCFSPFLYKLRMI